MVDNSLKTKFESIIEFENVQWETVEHILQQDANIYRPLKGVLFEEYFKKILRRTIPNIQITDGVGDSDVDVTVNNFKLQLKTPAKAPTILNKCIGISLHKTHGLERRPDNLYRKFPATFDFLVVLHPQSGILIIPYDEIPEANSYPGYLADPAVFPWSCEWLNKWGLIGLNDIDGQTIDDRFAPTESVLPFVSRETWLEDTEIVEALCKPEYFRAAVMGLKGNLKEFWFKEYLQNLGYKVVDPNQAYSKHDLGVENFEGKILKVQTKGTSKNMCNLDKCIIGFEIMGTHGQFPKRGYKKSHIDYVAVIISSNQLSHSSLTPGPHFIIIPVEDLPLHYQIGQGKSNGKPDWDHEDYADVIYPNIKLKLNGNNKAEVEFLPDLTTYAKKTIPKNSSFIKAGPYKLDFIPPQFRSSQ